MDQAPKTSYNEQLVECQGIPVLELNNAFVYLTFVAISKRLIKNDPNNDTPIIGRESLHMSVEVKSNQSGFTSLLMNINEVSLLAGGLTYALANKKAIKTHIATRATRSLVLDISTTDKGRTTRLYINSKDQQSNAFIDLSKHQMMNLRAHCISLLMKTYNMTHSEAIAAFQLTQ